MTFATKVITVNAADHATESVQCPSTYPLVTGGGAGTKHTSPNTIHDYQDIRIIESFPVGNTGWGVSFRNESGRPFNPKNIEVIVYAMCMS